MKKEVDSTLQSLEQSFKFDFTESEVKSDPTYNYVLSPEEENESKQIAAAS